ncbi:MAG: ion transporter [Oscillospiraceae bacterium]|nr:ion transporter [Oscillospiraceae bacterium]
MSSISKAKKAVFDIIQPSQKRNVVGSVFEWFILVLIIINVFLVVLDTFSGLPSWVVATSRTVEFVSLIIFTIEYVLRLWTSEYLYPDKKAAVARVKYAFSFMALVDLFAILPFYLPFIFPVDLRVLRMLRLVRLVRLLKINRYTKALSSISGVLRRKAVQLISSLFVLLILMLMASILMYTFEHEAQPDVFSNAFSGLWWAVATLTTVGYGDIFPITGLGRFLGTVIAFLGIGLVAVPTGIISSGFMEEINQNNLEEKSDELIEIERKIDIIMDILKTKEKS